MHDVITVGLPLLAIFGGILLNRADAKELRGEIKDVRSEIKDVRGEIKDVRSEIKDVRGEIKELRGEMNVRFNAVDAELRYFHGLTGKLDGRIEALEKK